jgi:hypothetical protein
MVMIEGIFEKNCNRDAEKYCRRDYRRGEGRWEIMTKKTRKPRKRK